MSSTTAFCVPSFLIVSYTFNAAFDIARKALSGYSVIATPTSASSVVVNSGVLPNSVRLASTGTFIVFVNCWYSSSVVSASAKIMSAPASTYAAARSSAACCPSTACASVRAMITKLSSMRPSAAAFSRSHISCVSTRALPGRWPQRLTATWSSMWQPAAPAQVISRTVRAIINALPQPVSASTSKGRSVAEQMRRMSSQTSLRVVIARSGSPNDALATPAPDR